MRVAVVIQDFQKGRGYIENALPRHLARAGAEVHLLTMDLSPDFPSGRARERGILVRPSDLPVGLSEAYDGYTLHVQGHKFVLGYPRMLGLRNKLRALRPDIVQTKVAIGWIPFDAALTRPELGFKLFTGNHSLISQFPLARRRGPSSFPSHVVSYVTRWLPGRIASLQTERCYAPTIDGAEIAWRYFGVQRRKVEVMHLGVDTAVFFPARSREDVEARQQLRRELGFRPEDIVCINTGKLSRVKNARILAEAVSLIRERQGMPFHALFIGEGEQREWLSREGSCRVLPLLPHHQLARYYRAADIGVWPTNESISTLDAAACGLPLIISDLVVYRDHVEGNGLVCRVDDRGDLAKKLLDLADAGTRTALGARGAAKMAAEFSWEGVARRRMHAYSAALEL